MANDDDADREREPWHHARFGSIAVRKRYVDAAQLHGALEQQRNEDADGRPHRLIGEILLDEGSLSPWELEDVLVTQADLASGSRRTGDTPSEAFTVGVDFDGEGVVRGSRPVHSPVASHAKTTRLRVTDVMEQVPTATADSLLGDALDAAFLVEAEAVLVLHGGDILGVLSVWDSCQLERGTPVLHVASPTAATVSTSTSLEEVALILRASEVPCVVVVSGGGFAGVVTRRALRRSGLRPAEQDGDAGPFTELGVSG